MVADADAELAPPRRDYLAACPHPVAAVERLEPRKGLIAEACDVDEQLDPTGHILEHSEHQLAQPSQVHQPTRYLHNVARAGSRLEVAIAIMKLSGEYVPAVADGIGIHAVATEIFDLLKASSGQWMFAEGQAIRNVAIWNVVLGCEI